MSAPFSLHPKDDRTFVFNYFNSQETKNGNFPPCRNRRHFTPRSAANRVAIGGLWRCDRRPIAARFGTFRDAYCNHLYFNTLQRTFSCMSKSGKMVNYGNCPFSPLSGNASPHGLAKTLTTAHDSGPFRPFCVPSCPPKKNRTLLENSPFRPLSLFAVPLHPTLKSPKS